MRSKRFFEPRFRECESCKFFNPDMGSVHCLPCGAGEFFEEKDPNTDLSDEELMEMFEQSDDLNDE